MPSGNGRYLRTAAVADRVRGRDSWADSAPTGVASGRTGVRAKVVIAWRARNRPHRPERDFVFDRRQKRNRQFPSSDFDLHQMRRVKTCYLLHRGYLKARLSANFSACSAFRTHIFAKGRGFDENFTVSCSIWDDCRIIFEHVRISRKNPYP